MKKLTPSGHSVSVIVTIDHHSHSCNLFQTSTDDDRKKNLLSSQESGCSNDRGSPCLSRGSHRIVLIMFDD